MRAARGPNAAPSARQRLSTHLLYRHRHLLAIEGLHPPEIRHLLDLAESYVLLNRSGQTPVLRQRMQRTISAKPCSMTSAPAIGITVLNW